MIAMLTGKVAEKLAGIIILDVQGIGYGLLVGIEDFGNMTVGQETRVYIYEHIREDAHDLYGFTKLDTKALFELLLSVNGVGPKMALNVLSIGTTGEVRQAIAAGDIKWIQAANGVGRRVAERVVVDLKDKVGLSSSESATSFLGAPSVQGDDAAQALMALGYTAQDATTALSGIDPSLPSEEKIKAALRSKK